MRIRMDFVARRAPRWRTWRLGAPRREHTSVGSRVAADIGGETVWFESDEAPLAASPEAFAGLFLIPAIRQRARLRVDAALDPTWLENTKQLLPILREWWGFDERQPIAARSGAAPPAPAAAEHSDGIGQCFSGGVDSFYQLLHQGDDVDCLVFVQGFDIPLGDARRMTAFDRSLREVADRVGKKAIVLRSNVRAIRRFERARWEKRTHGAALAAAGHVLAGTLGCLRIPATWPLHDLRPYGSSARTDRFWSSSWVRIEHGDASISRRDKVPRIAHDPLVREHLRVCWENLRPSGNCSRCEKCLRTMVGLEAHGALAFCETFDRTIALPRQVDALERLPRHLLTTWTTTLARLPDGPLREAVARLLRRSQP